MKEWAKLALTEATQAGCDYADIRIGQLANEEIRIKNGIVEHLHHHTDRGFGVRVLIGDGWGFASRPQLDDNEVVSAVREACEVALASQTVRREPVNLTELEAVEASYQTQLTIDPFNVPLEHKLFLLKRAEAALHINEHIVVGLAMMKCSKEKKWFYSTAGSAIEQETVIVGAGLQVISSDGKDVQVRSYPNTFSGNYAQAGYEFIELLDLVQHAPRIAEEAVQLLTAEPCPTQVGTLILHGSQLALQIHESCGHAVELDRVLGEEAGYAGKSFLTIDKLDCYRYGSEIVNLTADATTAGGLGTYLYDDDGVPAGRVPLVEKGILVGYLSSRETAPQIGRKSGGAMRAVGWQNVPIVRMTNIHLEPGQMSKEELIATTDEGIYMEGIKSWSIDDRRYQFQFGCEIAWEIKNGKRGRLFKNPVYQGTTPAFWQNCDGIADEQDWMLWGFINCGKGEPMQMIAVSHGTSTARFRNIQIGVAEQ
ncbi:TldD/PmbA family protein [Laceyella putida]|uniref:TldD/PmbA family protein n=1 Tax=Laceyella putida TaxID=110101 RepID=A0ABW2RGU3_9BACL